MKALPANVGELEGLRAARWIRESTVAQFDAFGPDSQREQQDRAIKQLGMIDTGITWSVAVSGWKIGLGAGEARMAMTNSTWAARLRRSGLRPRPSASSG